MEQKPQYRLYAGVDWAAEAHEVCAVSPEGERVLRKSFPHSGEGLAALCDALLGLAQGQADAVAVAIETPRGAVVEALLARGLHVHSVNPKQLDRLRDRHSVAGAKDDRLDAYVLADSLRHDAHLFRRLAVEESALLQLRELSRIEEELGREAVRLSNQLRELLLRYFPAPLTLCPAADEAWLWQLLKRAMAPEKAARLTRPTLDALLRECRIRRFSGQQLHDVLRAPPLRLVPGSGEAACAHVRLLLPRLELVAQQRKDVARQLDALLAQLAAPTQAAPEDAPGQKCEHRDVAVLLSLPGAGRTVAATVLAEGHCALEARDYKALRAHAGQAPVTRQSGKTAQVRMRRGCCPRLRHALYHWARVASQHDDHAHARYAAARARGHNHGRALRGVGDWLLRVLVAMLRTHSLYDPTKLTPLPT